MIREIADTPATIHSDAMTAAEKPSKGRTSSKAPSFEKENV